jgi:hypothetical protein
VVEIVNAGASYWSSLRAFAKTRRLTTPDEESALTAACAMPRRLPTDWQAAKLLAVRQRCEEAGFPKGG